VTRTNQRSLPLRQPQPPSRPAHAPRHAEGVPPARQPFHAWTPLGPPLPFESIPAWLRLPGEPGWIELDRFMRRVSGKGGAG
jgi:hypothetical protein